MGLRTLARAVAKNRSYRKCGTTDMFDYYFTKMWREKRGPLERNDRPTKKNRHRRG